MLSILKEWQRLSNDWAYLTTSLRSVPQIQLNSTQTALLSQIISSTFKQAHHESLD
ncbi:hypothetical protein [Yersinia mollaretii]|uniref:hypothetical protein n=1 Tax=Yersinia mollaretii TaxID=33060 RepID=UPI000AAABA46|nr:hypothetical protein [Yersinia mollaretii]MDA5525448.1 hypothetical protein [Yersinia mollaretii]MDR7872842.1 hypothetical protein [Yersinia mollaretii]WQC75976.1 hypothetical protein U1Z61_05435 [Yersinia mollaretii]